MNEPDKNTGQAFAPIPHSPKKPESQLARWTLIGVAVGVALPALVFFAEQNRSSESFAIIAGFANLLVPLVCAVVAIMFATMRSTRAFGLGLLLATGVCAFVQLALCGGAAALSH